MARVVRRPSTGPGHLAPPGASYRRAAKSERGTHSCRTRDPSVILLAIRSDRRAGGERVMLKMMRVLFWGAGFALLPLLLSGGAGEARPEEKQPSIRLRRPNALVLADGDKTLLVA